MARYEFSSVHNRYNNTIMLSHQYCISELADCTIKNVMRLNQPPGREVYERTINECLEEESVIDSEEESVVTAIANIDSEEESVVIAIVNIDSEEESVVTAIVNIDKQKKLLYLFSRRNNNL